MIVATSVGGLWVGSVASAGAVPSTLYAYPKGSTTPTTCPMTSTPATRCSLARAIALAATGDTVALAVAGTSKAVSTTYYEGAFRISKSVTLEAATGVTGPVIDAEGKAVVKTGVPATTSQALVVDLSATVLVRGVTLTGGVTLSTEASRGKGGDIENAGTLTIEDCTVSAGTADWGGGAYNTGTLTVTGSTFTHDTALLTAGAIFSTGHLTVEHSAFTTNSAVGLTPNIFLGFPGIKRGAGAVESSGGTASISDSTFTENGTFGFGGAVLNRGGSHMSVDGSTFTGGGATDAGQGGAIANYDTSGTTLVISPGTEGSTLTVSRSTITRVKATKGAALYNTGVATLVDSTISTSSGGSISDYETLSMAFDTLYHAGGGLTTTATWTAHPSISVADSILDKTTCAGATLVDGGHNVATTATCGAVAASATPAATLDLAGTLAPNTSTGPDTLAIGPKSAALDIVPGSVCTSTAASETDERGKPRPGITGQSSCDAGAYELQGTGASPEITSPPSTTFDVGAPGTYALTVTGSTFPDPTYTLTATAPMWLSAARAAGTGFTGVLEGTPPATSGGVYHVVVTAANGVGADAQPFTLSVDEAPVITSSNHADFVTTKAGSFQVTVRTSTYPAPTYSLVGAPTWLSIGSATGLMAGTPPSGSGGTSTFTVVATNTVAPATHQSFQLEVGTAPVISSADHAAFTVGEPTSFTVTVTPGLHPSPAAITETGTLPSGVTFATKGDDSASLSGSPAAGTAGTWQITIRATNGVTPPAVQDFTLRVVKQVPVVTWATPAPILYGTPLSGVQLDASTPVSGSFEYTPSAGTVLPPGTDTLHALFTPSTPGTYASVDATVTVSVGFSRACITSTLRTKLVVGRGQAVCATGRAVLKAGALVDAGGVLWMTGATADGLVASNRGSVVTVCGSDLAAGLEVVNSTGPVTVGGEGCAGDRISSVLSLLSNTGGVSVQGDTITGRMIVEHNSGPFVDEGNTVLGRATVRTNS